MEPATEPQVRAALRAVRVWPPGLEPAVAPGPDPDPGHGSVPLAGLDVDAYAAAICRRLGGAPRRVGQSTLVLGLASRLWSVTVVPAVTHGLLPDPAGLVVREDDGAVTLGVRRLAGWTSPTAADVRDVVLGVLEPLVAALPLARRLQWGNVAGSLYAVPRVHRLPAAAPLVRSLLAEPPLAGELAVAADGSARRRTCCLFYVVPGAGLCGDCVLDRVPARG